MEYDPRADIREMAEWMEAAASILDHLHYETTTAMRQKILRMALNTRARSVMLRTILFQLEGGESC